MLAEKYPSMQLIVELSQRRVPALHKETLAAGLFQMDSSARNHHPKLWLEKGHHRANTLPWEPALAALAYNRYPPTTEGDTPPTLPLKSAERHAAHRWRGRQEYVWEHFHELKPGDILPPPTSESSARPSNSRTYNTEYPTWLRTFFVNTPPHPDVCMKGPVHVSLGFSDLGELLSYTKEKEENDEEEDSAPVTFVGVDQSPYAVARSWVILAMLQDEKTTPEQIVEVWYSTVWTPSTLASFSRACQQVLAEQQSSLDENVKAFLVHWTEERPMSGQVSRALWWERTMMLPDQGFGRYVS